MLKDDRLVGVCLYGDTGDSNWYLTLLREGQNVSQLRNHLMFGQPAQNDEAQYHQAAA